MRWPTNDGRDHRLDAFHSRPGRTTAQAMDSSVVGFDRQVVERLDRNEYREQTVPNQGDERMAIGLCTPPTKTDFGFADQ